ncbi:MAG: 50S ribosomal protein L13 [Parcubacteria group bacterium]|nr:50S ribosomal protein L13 [Parcubacteria group bacterium]
MKTEVTIDAAGKSMGRVATEVSCVLQGKNAPSYERHILNAPTVNVTNLSKVAFTGKKLRQKTYRWHTGYIGHLKEAKLKDLFAKDPVKVFKRVVGGMLPKNKLRAKRLRKLVVKL